MYLNHCSKISVVKNSNFPIQSGRHSVAVIMSSSRYIICMVIVYQDDMEGRILQHSICFNHFSSDESDNTFGGPDCMHLYNSSFLELGLILVHLGLDGPSSICYSLVTILKVSIAFPAMVSADAGSTSRMCC
jgi:hypothetical protein